MAKAEKYWSREVSIRPDELQFVLLVYQTMVVVLVTMNRLSPFSNSKLDLLFISPKQEKGDLL